MGNISADNRWKGDKKIIVANFTIHYYHKHMKIYENLFIIIASSLYFCYAMYILHPSMGHTWMVNIPWIWVVKLLLPKGILKMKMECWNLSLFLYSDCPLKGASDIQPTWALHHTFHLYTINSTPFLSESDAKVYIIFILRKQFEKKFSKCCEFIVC